MSDDFLQLLGRKLIVLAAIDPKTKEIRNEQFTQVDAAALWAREQNAGGFNVYWTVNPTRDITDLLVVGKRPSSRDVESVFAWKADIDPIRPKDTSATDAEKEAAQEKVLIPLVLWLRSNLGRPPMVVDSGNGFNVLVRLNPYPAPTKEFQRACETLMDFLAAKFDVKDIAELDTSVKDLPRVLALPNTTKRKGANTAERPHREVRLVDSGEPVNAGTFTELATKIASLWGDRKVRRWVEKLPRFEQFHNAKLSFVAYLKKYARLDKETALRVVNLYVWLRGDPEWDMDAEERDNERMVDETFEKDDEDLSIKYLMDKDGEPTEILRALNRAFNISRMPEWLQRKIEPEPHAEMVLDPHDGTYYSPAIQAEIASETKAAPEAEFEVLSVAELIKNFGDKPLPWVHKPFLLRGELTLLVGAANIGKTTFVLQMLLRGATGRPWFLSNKPSKKTVRSLYFSLEMGEHPLSLRLKTMFKDIDTQGNLLCVVPRELALIPKTWDAIGRQVEKHKIDVVVIDNLLGADIGFDLNKTTETSTLMNEASMFARMYNVAVLLVHHTRKGQSQNATVNRLGVFESDNILDEATGSKVLVNRAGIRLFLQKRGNAKRLFIYSRFGPQQTVRLGWDKQNHIWKSSSKEEESGNENDGVVDEIDDSEPVMIHENSQEESIMIPTDDTLLDTPWRKDRVYHEIVSSDTNDATAGQDRQDHQEDHVYNEDDAPASNPIVAADKAKQATLEQAEPKAKSAIKMSCPKCGRLCDREGKAGAGDLGTLPAYHCSKRGCHGYVFDPVKYAEAEDKVRESARADRADMAARGYR